MGKNIKISFIGDISLNGQYTSLYRQGCNPFGDIVKSLSGMRHVIGNLECMPKGDHGENLLKKPRLSTNADTLEYLNSIGVTVVSLAQNHIYDHLESGFEKTIRFLEQHNIEHLGAGSTPEMAAKPLIINDNNIRIGFLNYVTADTNPNLPADARICLNHFDLSKACNDISQLRPHVDHLVLLLHWGGRVEGGMFPDYDQPIIARKLIDAGSDLIIGHHSHTFQPYEVYRGKYIFYSLGNFCFSDFEFEGKRYFMPKRRRITGVVTIFFDKQIYQVKIRFFKNMMTYFKPLRNYYCNVKFRNIIHKNILKFFFFWKIYFLLKSSFLPVYLFLIRPDISLMDKFNRISKSLERRLS